MIDGAVHIPLGAVPDSHRDLDPARPVILVCRSGRRSARAVALLTAAGLDAHTMSGRMLAWTAEGLPTVAPLTP